ncbi:MAG: hypothetical protein R2910_03440 [Gemmatimonadales bacterium]
MRTRAIVRALARTPVDRYATTGEFAEALLQAEQQERTPTSNTPVGVAPAEQSIVVLPLANMSADPENEYFSDGMTEEIINALAKIPGCRYVAHLVVRVQGEIDRDREVGCRLGVSSVLEGSVRKIGNRIRSRRSW